MSQVTPTKQKSPHVKQPCHVWWFFQILLKLKHLKTKEEKEIKWHITTISKRIHILFVFSVAHDLWCLISMDLS